MAQNHHKQRKTGSVSGRASSTQSQEPNAYSSRTNSQSNAGDARGAQQAGKSNRAYMHGFERFMAYISLAFLAGMVAVGVWMFVRSNLDAPLMILVIIGVLCFGCGIWAAATNRSYALAGVVLAASILIPTPWGLPPMIIGFVLFCLLIGLAVVVRW